MKPARFLRLLLTASVLSIASATADAGVNMKNGNFYISYTDILGTPVDGRQLEITRTYNSKSTDNGLFGFGWGSKYETRLAVRSDGTLVTYEHGAGAELTFRQDYSGSSLEQVLDDVESALEALDWHRSRKQLDSLLAEIAGNADYRTSTERFFLRRNALDVEPPEPGDIYWNHTYGTRMIVILKTGFLRLSDDDSEISYELFDTEGRLSRIGYRNGRDLNLSYDSNGQLMLLDLGGESGFQFRYSDDRLSSITDLASGDSSRYIFDGNNLVRSTDTAGNLFVYEYDYNHNMTAIRYQDGTVKTIEYLPEYQFARKITDPDGEVTLYEYGNIDNYTDYWTEITSHAGTDREQKVRHRWVIGFTETGYSWQKLYQISREGQSLGIERSPEDLITALILGKEEKRLEFAYGRDNRLERMEGPGMLVSYNYSTSFLNRIDVEMPGLRTSLDFAYGDFGLEEIRRDDGRNILFSYGSDGLLEHTDINLGSGRLFVVRYNQDGDPDDVEGAKGLENVEGISGFWNAWNKEIYRTFFEFYQYHKPFAKILWDGEFTCGECSTGFTWSSGYLTELASDR